MTLLPLLLLLCLLDLFVLLRGLAAPVAKQPFFDKGLNFECSGCGKCCRSDGEVWLDTEEYLRIRDNLRIGDDEFINSYIDIIADGWVSLRNNYNDENPLQGDSCIFLSQSDLKTCTIYSCRPVQCSTYPWWPRLLSSRGSWDEEAVLSDADTGKGRRWSPEHGGCEGITATAPVVPPEVIRANNNLYNAYNKNFPSRIGGGDVNRFLLSAAITADVIKGTMQYLADSGTAVGADKLSAYLRDNKQAFFDKLKYEMIRVALSGSGSDEIVAFVAVPQLDKMYANAGDFQRDLGAFLAAHSATAAVGVDVRRYAAAAPYPLLAISKG